MDQKVVRMINSMSMCEVRSVYINRVRAEQGRIDEARSWLVSRGYIELSDIDESSVIDAGDAEYLPDGRVLVRAQGRLWALSKDKWDEQISDAIKQAQQRDAIIKSQNQAAETSGSTTICTNLIDGQLCGGELSRKPICPKHHLWTYGVREILTCDVCGAQTAVMR